MARPSDVHPERGHLISGIVMVARDRMPACLKGSAEVARRSTAATRRIRDRSEGPSHDPRDRCRQQLLGRWLTVERSRLDDPPGALDVSERAELERAAG
jgi:hypothetical protein